MKNKSEHERLLVIDDEENMRHMLQTLLRTEARAFGKSRPIDLISFSAI